MSYKTAILANNPIHWWRCNETPGARVLYDSGNTPTYLGAATQLHETGGTSISGYSAWSGNPGLGWSGPASDGGGLSLYGPGFVAYNQFSPFTGATPPYPSYSVPGSLECWAVGGVNNGCSIGFYWPQKPTPTNWAGFEIFFGSSLGTLFDLVTGMSGPGANNAFWHHFVSTWTDSQFDYYVDGSHIGNTSISQPLGATGRIFGFGPGGQVPFMQQSSSGFMSEIAIYNTALTAGDVANHHAAAERPSTRPFYVGSAGSSGSTPPALTGLTEGTLHTGLTTTGEIILASTFAIKVAITTVPPFLGEAFSDTPFYYNAGWITPIAAEGSLQPIRIVAGEQLIYLPPLTTAISWSIPATEVISITELAGVFS